MGNLAGHVKCTEKTLLAASAIFGGLTFLLPSALTVWMYWTRWIPEEPDPVRREQMKLILAGSAAAGAAVIVGGVWYLKNEKCI